MGSSGFPDAGRARRSQTGGNIFSFFGPALSAGNIRMLMNYKEDSEALADKTEAC
jgi:hypothetical protein